jgi:hypothetical protein
MLVCCLNVPAIVRCGLRVEEQQYAENVPRCIMFGQISSSIYSLPLMHAADY